MTYLFIVCNNFFMITQGELWTKPENFHMNKMSQLRANTWKKLANFRFWKMFIISSFYLIFLSHILMKQFYRVSPDSIEWKNSCLPQKWRNRLLKSVTKIVTLLVNTCKIRELLFSKNVHNIEVFWYYGLKQFYRVSLGSIKRKNLYLS